jgi:hypothetical protein
MSWQTDRHPTSNIFCSEPYKHRYCNCTTSGVVSENYNIVTCRLKARISEPALFPRQRRVTHLGNNWGRLLRYNAFGWKRFRCNGTLGTRSSKRLLKEESAESWGSEREHQPERVRESVRQRRVLEREHQPERVRESVGQRRVLEREHQRENQAVLR